MLDKTVGFIQPPYPAYKFFIYPPMNDLSIQYFKKIIKKNIYVYVEK